jgi:hypothetical protein
MNKPSITKNNNPPPKYDYLRPWCQNRFSSTFSNYTLYLNCIVHPDKIKINIFLVTYIIYLKID